MMKISILCVAFILLVSQELDARAPLSVKKSVAFIFTRDTSNRLIPKGTAFFLLMKAEKNKDTASFGYLVTTRSVITKPDGTQHDTLYIRINKKDQSADTLIIPLVSNEGRKFFGHPDSSVNLALLPAYPDLNRYDILYTPAGMIAPIDFIEKEKISEGDEVFHAGMLALHTGIFKNVPSVSFGTIVQFSNEKYRWNQSYTELFLVESPVSEESSGSPLFYFSPAASDTGASKLPQRFFLAGIVAGPYGDGGRLAGIIPAYKLSELLFSQPVSEEREKEFMRLQNRTKQ